VTIFLVVVVAILHTIFKKYIPEEIKGNIIEFITSAVGTSKIIYDMVTSGKVKVESENVLFPIVEPTNEI
jgi:hypothetical protein